MINKIKKKIKNLLDSTVRYLINTGTRFRMPLLCAIGWRLGLRKKDTIKQRKWTRRKFLVLAKSGGVDDIEAAYDRQDPDYAVLLMPRRLVKIIFNHYLDSETLSDLKYLNDDETIESKKLEYRAFLEKVVKRFRLLFGLDAMAQFNILYYAERELAAACTNVNVAFVTVYKENLRSKEAWNEVTGSFQGTIDTYRGWKIAVYNADAKQMLIESGIAKPWQITVTGCPRMDFSHSYRNNHRERSKNPVFLYYMITPIAGLTGSISKEEMKRLNWNKMIDKVNATIVKFASEHPEVRMIAKGKTGYSTRQIDRFGGDLPSNFEVIKDGAGHKLLEQADVVIGFNSTAVLEAVAAGIPTIVPHIFTDYENRLVPYVHPVKGAVHAPESEAELEETILELAKNGKHFTELEQGQKDVLDDLMFNSDGKAGERLKQFLDEAMEAGCRQNLQIDRQG
jgi:hypothetical protein